MRLWLWLKTDWKFLNYKKEREKKSWDCTGFLPGNWEAAAYTEQFWKNMGGKSKTLIWQCLTNQPIQYACVQSRLNCFWLFATLWTVARQAPLPMKIHPSQEHWSGSHALLQGIFPTQGSDPRFLSLQRWQADSLPLVLYHFVYTYSFLPILKLGV